jgi:hypothetical protein
MTALDLGDAALGESFQKQLEDALVSGPSASIAPRIRRTRSARS